MNRFRGLLLAVLLALCAPAAAAGQLALAVHAGVMTAALDGADPEQDSDGSRRGFSLGGALTLPVSPRLGLQLGAAYVQKGASLGVVADDIIDAFFADVKLDYYELSVLAKVSIPAGFTSLHLLAGPTVAFQSSCLTDLTYSLGGDTVEADFGFGPDYSDVPCSVRDYGLGIAEVEDTDFGVAGGVGLEVPVGLFVDVSLELLHIRGLSEVIAGTENRATILRAGVSLPIG